MALQITTINNENPPLYRLLIIKPENTLSNCTVHIRVQFTADNTPEN